MTRRSIARYAVATAALFGASPLLAQGNLSTFGFGYPPGQLSTRAVGTGGAIGELDPLSPLNPAALANWGGSAVYFQFEPEFRRVETGSVSERTTTARYPVIGGALSLGTRWTLGISASTLLDRTWATTSARTHVIDGEDVPSTTTFRSEGALNDVRIGLAWLARPWLRFGVGAHAITGQNRVSVVDVFEDTARFDPLRQDTLISYRGAGASVGVEARAGRVAAVGASLRFAGRVRAVSEETTLSRANAPLRFGVTVAYLGVANSLIAFRTAYDRWSSLEDLGRPGLRAVDGWDTSIGADVAGPRIAADRMLMLRAGFRWRTLPFAVTVPDIEGGTTGPAETVRERSFTGGVGTSLARGRATIDLGVVRASRDAGLSIDEQAWILSIGMSVRP